MCELLAMSSRYPASVSFSLEEFARRGGMSGPHKDGWGIAFYEQGDAMLIREADSAATSPCVEFIRQQKYPSSIIIAHVRKATVGDNTLKNTQPFARELGGRMHVFAHNGDLTGIRSNPGFPLGIYHPVGETDSEWSFCHLMHLMQGLWLPLAAPPSLDRRFRAVATFARKMQPLGPANFVYSDGEYLFVHGHQRTQPGLEGFHPPGLYWICRTCSPGTRHIAIPGLSFDPATRVPRQKAVLIASVPLTDEQWKPLKEGEILVFKGGELVAV
jgi:glutamine amidotransferase